MFVRCIIIPTAAVFTTLVFAVPTLADPLPNEILKFQNLPLNSGLPVIAPYTGPYIAPNPFPLPGGMTTPAPFAPFPGHDERSTALLITEPGVQPAQWQGNFMADDFADRFSTPVVHVRWWGSYLNNQRFAGVTKFLVTFESDVPAGAAGPSHPGTPLLNQIVTKGALAPLSGTFTESGPISGAAGVPEPLYQYNAELHLPFAEAPNTVYWLKIVALVDPNTQGPVNWGWHDRDYSVPNLEASIPPAVVPGEGVVGIIPGSTLPLYHFQDDAVSGNLLLITDAQGNVILNDQVGFVPQNYQFPTDGLDGIQNFSKDLAFELYTNIPEPASLTLFAAGSALLLVRRKR